MQANPSVPVADRSFPTPRAGARPIARRALCVLVVCGLALCIGCGQRRDATGAGDSATRGPSTTGAATVEELDAQIWAIRFVNSLKLTDDQVAKLTEVLAAPRAQAADREKRVEELEAKLLPLLEQERSLLAARQSIPESLSSQTAQLRGEAAALRSLDPQAESELAGNVRGILKPDQIAIAAGESGARDQALEMLAGFRQLSADEFDEQIGPFCRQATRQDSGPSADAVEATFREARTMSDEEYTQNADKLAAQISALFTPTGETADWLIAEAFMDPHVQALFAGQPSTVK